MSVEYEVIADEACRCGEGPIWHVAQGRLYWLDNVTGRLFWYDPKTNHHELALQYDGIAAATVQVDGSLLLFGRACGVWRWDGGEPTVVVEPTPGESRFNDVAADPKGRVFAGSMPVPDPDNPGKTLRLGTLYRFDPDGSRHEVEHDLGCSNGIGFSPDLTLMYFVDSVTHQIFVYDYNPDTGEIRNRRVFAEVDHAWSPDGLTVDAEGCVWCAMWNGSRVIRFSPDGEPIRTIMLPTPMASSVMFGGPGLDELYITSAGGQDKQKNGQHAGALFRVRPGMHGKPEFLSRLFL